MHKAFFNLWCGTAIFAVVVAMDEKGDGAMSKSQKNVSR